MNKHECFFMEGGGVGFYPFFMYMHNPFYSRKNPNFETS